MVTDAAQCSLMASLFSGILQILSLFSLSVQPWVILHQHVKQLAVKSLSTTTETLSHFQREHPTVGKEVAENLEIKVTIHETRW